MEIDKPITIAIILLVILLLVFFLVVPQYQAFGSLQTQLAEKKAEYNAQKEYYDEITKTYMQLEDHKDDIAKIDDALPQDNNLGQLVYYFSRTATENGMLVKSLFLSQPVAVSNLKSSTGVKNIVISVSMLGDYNSLEQFLIALEKSARLFEVTNISFGAAVSSATSSTLQSQPQTNAQAQTQSKSQLQSQAASQFQSQQTQSFSLQVVTHSY